MTAAPPPWIDAGVRIVEAGRLLGWAEIAAEADRLEPVFRSEPAAVQGRRVGGVVAALVAAERAGVPLHLRRHPGPPAEAGPPGFALLLESSGTTGKPKRVRHDFDRLRGRLRGTADRQARWLLTYEPASFAGLQVVLTMLAAGALLVAAPGEGAAALARQAVTQRVTHASGTPSFWRAFLMALGDGQPPLRSVTLGGEAADQPLLDRLARRFPAARLRHIYAATETGALFAVSDGRAGFPAAWLEEGVEGVGLRVRDGVLEVLSPRAMLDGPGMGDGNGPGVGEGGWLSTGDLVEIEGDRALFVGRADGRVNVGGVKVSPERAERLLLAVPGIRDAAVEAAANPVTGHILTARVVPEPGVGEAALRAAIRDAAAVLEPAARPRAIRLVDSIPLSAAGKKSRGGAA